MYAPPAPSYPSYEPYPSYPAPAYPYPPTQGRGLPAHEISRYDAPPYRPHSNHLGGSVMPADYVTHQPGWRPPSSGGYHPGYRPPSARSSCVTVCNRPPPPPRVSMPSTILIIPDPWPDPSPKKPHTTPPPPPRPAPRPAPPPPPAHDEDLRPWLGVTVKWLDDEFGGKDNVAVVEQVAANSPAEKAKLKKDDQLEYWNGQKIDSNKMWLSKMKAMRVGDTVNIDIHRNGADLKGFKVRIEGTTKQLGNKRVVQSVTKTETHNYEG